MKIPNRSVRWLGWNVTQTALLNGFLLNLFGWMGNAIILKSEWRAVAAVVTQVSPLNFSGMIREAMSLVPDFIYGYLMVVIYSYIGLVEGFTLRAKLQTILIAFLFGLFTTYFGLVTSNLLPERIGLLTTGWGLLTFFPAFILALSLTRFDKKFL